MASHSVEEFQLVLSNARRIVVLAGAGLSAASGIPTFRGIGGLWRNHDAMALATPQAFAENPSLVWQFYHYRRETAFSSQPNAAHKVLAMLSASEEKLRAVAPQASLFKLVTQNVDGLSVRALPDSATASAQPIEMHGNVARVKCTNKECEFDEYNFASPICAGLRGTEAHFRGDNEEAEPVVQETDLPHCSKCGSLLRPGVVWFGESTEHLEEIAELVTTCDLFLVVGTSSTVAPASIFADVARDGGAKVAVFNIEHTSRADKADFLFLGPCEETLPKALGPDISGH